MDVYTYIYIYIEQICQVNLFPLKIPPNPGWVSNLFKSIKTIPLYLHGTQKLNRIRSAYLGIMECKIHVLQLYV